MAIFVSMPWTETALRRIIVLENAAAAAIVSGGEKRMHCAASRVILCFVLEERRSGLEEPEAVRMMLRVWRPCEKLLSDGDRVIVGEWHNCRRRRRVMGVLVWVERVYNQLMKRGGAGEVVEFMAVSGDGRGGGGRRTLGGGDGEGVLGGGVLHERLHLRDSTVSGLHLYRLLSVADRLLFIYISVPLSNIIARFPFSLF